MRKLSQGGSFFSFCREVMSMKKEKLYWKIAGLLEVFPIIITGYINVLISTWRKTQGITDYMRESMKDTQLFVTTLLLLLHIVIWYVLKKSKLSEHLLTEKEKSMGIGTWILRLLSAGFYVMVYWNILR